jgi:hypothetical protein
MYVIYYLQKEQTREKQEPFIGRLGLKKWKAKYYFTCRNDEDEDEDEDEDCSEANVEVLSTTESSYGAPSSTQEEEHEFREYPKQVCESLTEGNKLWTKLTSVYSESLKEDNQLYGEGNLYALAANTEKTEQKMKALDLDIEKFLDQYKQAEVVEKQLNLLTVKRDQVRKNKDAVIHEVECLLEETEVTRKNMDYLNLKAENVHKQCTEPNAMEKQRKFVTAESDQVIEDQESVMREVACLSEEIELARKDMSDLKLKLGSIRDQCKESKSMVKQMKLVSAGELELRRNKHAVINEAEYFSEGTEFTRKNMDELNFEAGNIREECNEAEALQNQLNFVTEQGDQLREIDDEALMYEAKSSSK